jgi:hypothetical protein
VIQFSCVSHDLESSETKGEFNQYVKPPAHAKWNEHASQVHGIRPTDTRIVNAQPIEGVWPLFVQFINQQLENDKVGILAAWNGKSSDLKWLFRITEETHHNQLSMPTGIKNFMDPMMVIRHYKSCKLNMKHATINSYALASVWMFVKEKDDLPNAHDSLVDAKAQMDVVVDSRFTPFINKSQSIVLWDDVWMAKKKTAAASRDELTRATPDGWHDTLPETNTLLDESLSQSFEGASLYGPTNHAQACALK